MNFKRVFAVLVLGLTVSLFAFAADHKHEAKGSVVYKKSDGTLVKNDATLTMTEVNGKHEITIKETASGTEAKTHATFTQRRGGRTIFYMVFVNPPGHEGKALIFKGTYARGKNLAVYYGDFFAMTYTGENSWKLLRRLMRNPHHGRMKYKGGFYFEAETAHSEVF